MKTDVERMIRGFENGREQLEKLRIKTIRESDIVRQAPAFDTAFMSAKFTGFKKPITGLGELGILIAKMNK